MQKVKILLPIALFFMLALGFVLGSKFQYTNSPAGIGQSAAKNKLNTLLELIETEYVDQIETDSLVDDAVNAILAHLDPHSTYIPSSDQAELAENMKGNFVGIGVNFYMYKDSVAVISPLPKSPAQKAGILAGDRILYAGKTKLFGRKLPSDSLYAHLKGEVGSAIQLTLYRKSERRIFKTKLLRDRLPIKSVDVAVLVEPKIGYIKINRFAETTYAEFSRGLQKLKRQGATTLILDVRANGGGYLEMATQIADDFLKNGQKIVLLKNRKGPVEKTVATEKGSFESGKVLILQDENSASASEILAGAIQDNDRGLVIGRRSFGKGLVQRELPFDDGSAVRLTMARYYTPSGRSIQKSYKKGTADYENEFENRFANGELYNKDSIKIADSLKFKTPKGRIVYGGGGIVPDIFVPLSANKGDEQLVYIIEQTGLVSHFAFEQLDKHRNEYRNLNRNEFIKRVKGNGRLIRQFELNLQANGIDVDLRNNTAWVQRSIQAEMVRQLFGEEAYFQLILPFDPMVQAALRTQK
ncbi:MAG: S41 family peptidase [Flavobacterium sp.]|nr:S41 family peptidase [Flavobacterium sp.]